MRFSIIIPVYNAEKYLQQCIESILAQTYMDFEILLINDGSTDQSGALCDEFSKKDPRIYAVHIENQGAAYARNLGFIKAKGEYIYFMDSDDFLCNNHFLQYVSNIADAEPFDFLQLIYTNAKEYGTFLPNNQSWNIPEFNFQNVEKKIEIIIEKSMFTISPWSKVIRKDFLLTHNITFQNGLFAEDIDWSFELLSKTNDFSILNDTVYVYRKQPNSMSLRMSTKQLEDYVYILEKWKKNLETANNNRSRQLLRYLSYEYYVGLGMISCMEDQRIQTELIDRMNKLSALTSYKLNWKTTLCSIIFKFFGIKTASRIMGYYINHK